MRRTLTVDIGTRGASEAAGIAQHLPKIDDGGKVGWFAIHWHRIWSNRYDHEVRSGVSRSLEMEVWRIVGRIKSGKRHHSTPALSRRVW